MAPSQKEAVAHALDRARDNGYDLSCDTLEDIANDLRDFDKDFEHVDPTTLCPLIDDWRKAHPSPDPATGREDMDAHVHVCEVCGDVFDCTGPCPGAYYAPCAACQPREEPT